MRFSSVVTGALVLCLSVTTAHAEFVKESGDGKCPEGYRQSEMWEVKKDSKSACNALAEWDIARLAEGASMGGSGYKCEVQANDTRELGHTLCVEAPALSAAVGTFTWTVNNKPNGETTLNADGTCSNTASKMDCVWIVSNPEQRQFTLNWADGRHIDTMTLSSDGKTIEGKNQGGDVIKGTRK